MGDVGSCYDNAVVERFFGSLKHDWIFKFDLTYPQAQRIVSISLYMFIVFRGRNLLKNKQNTLS
jgi:transposase InsO family protein